jgi:hypothetical protein
MMTQADGPSTCRRPRDADMEVTFRQVGAGALLFPFDRCHGQRLDGFLNQTGGAGSVVTCKFVATGVWDLIGRLAEDVTA